MPIHKQKIVQISKSNAHDIASTNADFDKQIQFTLNDSKKMLGTKKICEVTPFIFWNDFWNQFGIYSPGRDSMKDAASSNRYSRGRKVFVDFGCSNVGKETSLPHPAFIIYNFAETAIVVPTTSDDGSVFSREMEPALIRCKKDGKIFPADTLINLHQIRVISKNRIIKDLKCDARDYIVTDEEVDRINSGLAASILHYGADLQKCIETQISRLYTPDVLINYAKLNHNYDDLNRMFLEVNHENEELKKTILMLQHENEEYKKNDKK